MPEYFITANTYGRPMLSDDGPKFVQADTPEDAIAQFQSRYKHPIALSAVDVYGSVDDYYKGRDTLANYRRPDETDNSSIA